jgi:hypothetical protein
MLFHLSAVRLAQADNVYLASARREHYGVQPATDKSKYPVTALAIFLAIILFDHRFSPIKLLNQRER